MPGRRMLDYGGKKFLAVETDWGKAMSILPPEGL